MDPDGDAPAEHAARLLGSGDLDGARVAAEACIATNPGDFDCNEVLVDSFTRRGLYDERLLRAAIQCLAHVPRHPSCLWAVAQYHLREGNLDEAKEFVALLSALQPDSNDTLVLAAQYAEATGDTEGACVLLHKACAQHQPYACRHEVDLCARR